MDAMSVYNIKVDLTSYNDEFHGLAIWKQGAFLQNSFLAIGSERRISALRLDTVQPQVHH